MTCPYGNPTCVRPDARPRPRRAGEHVNDLLRAADEVRYAVLGDDARAADQVACEIDDLERDVEAILVAELDEHALMHRIIDGISDLRSLQRRATTDAASERLARLHDRFRQIVVEDQDPA
jgi:hypothetical protein